MDARRLREARESDQLKPDAIFDKGKVIERWRRKVTGLTGHEPHDGGTAEIQSHRWLPRSRNQIDEWNEGVDDF
jgi:hypothetical protein